MTRFRWEKNTHTGRNNSIDTKKNKNGEKREEKKTEWESFNFRHADKSFIEIHSNWMIQPWQMKNGGKLVVKTIEEEETQKKRKPNQALF